VLAGVAFILPAMLITLACAWLYVRYGTTPSGEDLLNGIKPVVIAIVAQAIYGLGRAAIVKPTSLAIAAVATVLYLLGVNELLIMVAGAAALMAISRIGALTRPSASSLFLLPAMAIRFASSDESPIAYSALRLFLTFLKIGSVLYGSGYVLVAFLRTDFVERYGWLTERQLLDAVAVGQVTPGPVFTTATFIGYVTGGFDGAVLATAGIFLPAFVFVALIHRHVETIRSHPVLSIALDGVNAATIGLMLGVAIELTRDAYQGIESAMIAVIAAVLLVRFKTNATWIVLGGGLFGLLFYRL
jgi:chromate transporter